MKNSYLFQWCSDIISTIFVREYYIAHCKLFLHCSHSNHFSIFIFTSFSIGTVWVSRNNNFLFSGTFQLGCMTCYLKSCRISTSVFFLNLETAHFKPELYCKKRLNDTLFCKQLVRIHNRILPQK